jgi:hypothetical protein
MYMALNISKERNRRIFEGKSNSMVQVFGLAKEKMVLRRVACAHLCIQRD